MVIITLRIVMILYLVTFYFLAIQNRDVAVALINTLFGIIWYYMGVFND